MLNQPLDHLSFLLQAHLKEISDEMDAASFLQVVSNISAGEAANWVIWS